MSEHMTADMIERMHLSVDDYMTSELRNAIRKATEVIDLLRREDRADDGYGLLITCLDAITDHDIALMREAGRAARS